MVWLDYIIILLLVFAVWEGWKQGLVTQVLGLVAVAAGIFLAWRFGASIGESLGMEDVTATCAGFAIVLVAVIVGVVLIGRFTRGLFKIVGLGVFDNILGVMFSALKMFVLVGLAVMLLEVVDPDGRILSDRVKERSPMFRAVDDVNGIVFSFVKDLFDTLP